MAAPFEIVSTTDRVDVSKMLAPPQAGFAVRNLSARPIELEASVVPGKGAEAGWFEVENAERSLAAGGSAQFAVSISVPSSATTGEYELALRVADAGSPEDVAVSAPVKLRVIRGAAIARLLPSVFQSAAGAGRPIGALLAAMETLQSHTEAALAALAACFDPSRAPEKFVPFLARMVFLDLEVTTGPERLRALVASAVLLSQWRGTARGLQTFLEIATGQRGFVIEEPAGDSPGVRPFHIRVTAPAVLAPHEEMLQRIIRLEKPVFVTHELHFA